MKLIDHTKFPIPAYVLMDNGKVIGHIKKIPHLGVWQAKLFRGYKLNSGTLAQMKIWILSDTGQVRSA